MIILILVILLVAYYFMGSKIEMFTIPSLTLSKPPLWFPQNASEKYNKKRFQEKMYLDRYKKNEKASVYRFWRN